MALGSNWGSPPQTGNNTALLSNIRREPALRLLNIRRQRRIDKGMKHRLIPLAVAALISTALPAVAAGCYADYKAKQDDPLRLHYGVAQIAGACTADNAQAELADRLAAQGWTLLNVVSVFGDEGLEQRKDSAGTNYLRF